MTTTDLTPWAPPTDTAAETARRQAEHRAEIGRKVDTAGSLTVLTIAVTGVAFTANTSPDLVGYPICAAIAAMVVCPPMLYRRPKAAR